SVSRSPWEFAVEVGQLHAAGVNNTDLRWLLSRGYAEHARERRRARARRRAFPPPNSPAIPPPTRFVPTPPGRQLAAPRGARGSPAGGGGAARARPLPGRGRPFEPPAALGRQSSATLLGGDPGQGVPSAGGEPGSHPGGVRGGGLAGTRRRPPLPVGLSGPE